MRLGFILQQENLWEDALAYWDERARLRWRDDFAAGGALAALRCGRPDEADQRLEEALKRSPRSVSLHQVLCGLRKEQDRIEEALAAEKRALFYDALLPSSELVYSDARWDVMADLGVVSEWRLESARPADDARENFEYAIEAERRESSEARRARVRRRLDVLQAEASDEAVELLAALVWQHGSHGEVEDTVVDWLAESGNTVALQRILVDARSACTIGNCLRGLAMAKAPGVFERLVDALPNDGGMFGMGILESLQSLQDERTPAAVMAHLESENPARAATAVVVLADFNTPDVREFLERWETQAPESDQQIAATAALYRFNPDKLRRDRLRKAIKRMETYDTREAVEILRSIDSKDARDMVKAWDKKAERD